MHATTTGLRSPVDRFFEFSLLGLLTSGYLAVVGSGYLDTPTVLLTAAALLLRGLLVSGLIQYRIPPGVIAAVTLGYMGFYPVDYAFVSRAFLPATVHLVFFIAIVKILTATTNRDYIFVKLIAFMELLAACVLSSSINFFLFLALFLLLGVATFASSEIRRSAQTLGAARAATPRVSFRLASATLFVSTGILLLTGALFFLLPRTARAAFQHLLSHRYHIAGFSNEISLGEIGEIKKQDTPVMHVKMDPGQERLPVLRWRGSALAQFDGRRWYNTRWRGDVLRPNSSGQLRLSGWRPDKGISYAVHLNDVSLDGILFFAGTPQSLHIDAPLILRTPVDSYRLISGGSTYLNYEVFSYLDPSGPDPAGRTGDPAPALSTEDRSLYLRLPSLDPRISTLTQSISAIAKSPDEKARVIESYLRRTYQYTLELPQTEAADPIANFLFRRRKGHCEYFASSMAVMLRTIGIPSRVVTGFLGGLYNPISGWQVIRASDAHSWVEAYIPHLGWTTFDPTPPDPHPPAPSVFSRLGLYVDAAEVFWQDWVINYNLDRQLVLASQMEQSGHNLRMSWIDDLTSPWPSWKSKAASDFGSVYGILAIPALVVVILLARYGARGRRWWHTRLRIRKLKRGQVHRTDATMLYERMLKALRRRGIEKPDWLTPSEFARVVGEPALSILVADITLAYNELRFGGKPEAGVRMMAMLSRLESSAI
ncbi:MAG: transglutaminase TgpA family protein [Bryobacteraceae bacterium]